jgi:DNA-binding PadR family transcriptional regulator
MVEASGDGTYALTEQGKEYARDRKRGRFRLTFRFGGGG